MLLLGNLAIIGTRLELGAAYYVGVGFAACFALYQQRLIRKREPAKCFEAFLNNNWFGVSVFSGIVLDYIFAHA